MVLQLQLYGAATTVICRQTVGDKGKDPHHDSRGMVGDRGEAPVRRSEDSGMAPAVQGFTRPVPPAAHPPPSSPGWVVRRLAPRRRRSEAQGPFWRRAMAALTNIAIADIVRPVVRRLVSMLLET